MTITRRTMLSGTAMAGGCLLLEGINPQRLYAQAAATRYVANQGELQPAWGYPLPVGSVKPTGWLLQQLQIQARGLCGNVDNISGYLGTGYDTAWSANPDSSHGGVGLNTERMPYWLDGLVPLAYMLDGPLGDQMKDKVRRALSFVLTPNGSGQYDKLIVIWRRCGDPGKRWWPVMPMLKALMQYHEATGDPAAIETLDTYFRHQNATLPTEPLQTWAQRRWQDNLIVVIWLYNRRPEARTYLLDLMRKLATMGPTASFDWPAFFNDTDEFSKRAPASKDRNPAGHKHGVNVAQALKVGMVLAALPGQAAYPQANEQLLGWLGTLDAAHGLPHGSFTSSEFLGGKDVANGPETCTVVEELYSFEYALATGGNARFGDRIERIAYNALPAALDRDMRTRQYVSTINQINASGNAGSWTSCAGGEVVNSTVTGEVGCCTVNFAQGWPKLVQSMWIAVPARDGVAEGLAAALYGPSKVTTRIGGASITLEQKTDYPFGDGSSSIVYTGPNGHRFSLRVRVPTWRDAITVRVGNTSYPSNGIRSGWVVIDRVWTSGDTVSILVETTPRAQAYNGSSYRRDGTTKEWIVAPSPAVFFNDGPLLFAMGLPGKIVYYKGVDNAWVGKDEDLPYVLQDYNLELSTLSQDSGASNGWAYAASLDPGIHGATRVPVARSGWDETPFSPSNPRTTLAVDLNKVTGGWTMRRWGGPKEGLAQTAAMAPPPPVLTAAQVSSATTARTLVPYGCAKLRLTAFARIPGEA